MLTKSNLRNLSHSPTNSRVTSSSSLKWARVWATSQSQQATLLKQLTWSTLQWETAKNWLVNLKFQKSIQKRTAIEATPTTTCLHLQNCWCSAGNILKKSKVRYLNCRFPLSIDRVLVLVLCHQARLAYTALTSNKSSRRLISQPWRVQCNLHCLSYPSTTNKQTLNRLPLRVHSRQFTPMPSRRLRVIGHCFNSISHCLILVTTTLKTS